MKKYLSIFTIALLALTVSAVAFTQARAGVEAASMEQCKQILDLAQQAVASGAQFDSDAAVETVFERRALYGEFPGRFACLQDGTEGVVSLYASEVDTYDGPAAVMVALSDNTLLMSESRRDADLEGVLVYRVEFPDGGQPIIRQLAVLGEGETYAECGVELTNAAVYDDGDDLQVSVPASGPQCSEGGGMETPSAVDACKLPMVYTDDVALGFPRPDWYLPSTGTVKVAVIFVDFPDVPADKTPEEVFAMVNPGAVEYFEKVSYGRMHMELVPHLKWLRLSQPSAHYGSLLETGEGHDAFMQEAVDLADAEVDFSGVDMLLVLANPDAEALEFGPAAPQTAIKTDEGVITRGVTSGNDLPYWGFLWLNHEMGHILSLVDLYDFDATWGNEGDSPYAGARFTGIWSLMNDISEKGPEYFAFERWQLGWLDDAQIACQTSDEQVATISAIEQAGGTKAVIVPLGTTSALVIESRRAAGYDIKIPKEGALAYVVNTAIRTGEGAIQVLPINENDPLFEKAPLAEGESLTYCGVTITNEKFNPDGDQVRVSIPEEGVQCEAETVSAPATCTDIAAPSGSDTVVVQFVNTTSSLVIGYWDNPSGNLEEYFRLAPGERTDMETYPGNKWVLQDLSGATVLEYTATEDKTQCSIPSE